jgi:hypothetical protein
MGWLSASLLLVALRPPDAALGSPEGALRVVRVRNGRTEEGVNGIADVLFDGSALRRDDPSELAEGAVKGAFEALGTERDRQGCRADDVHEERCDYAALDAPFSHGTRQAS